MLFLSIKSSVALGGLSLSLMVYVNNQVEIAQKEVDLA
jgi:hypothetical protein